MKPERLTVLLKWWADTRQKMLRSDKADIIRGAVKHANGQDYIPSDDGESLNIIEIFRSVMTAYEEASANGERERLSTAHEGLVYLSAMFEMLERGCEDGAISYACLEPDGAVSVTLAINPNGRGGSTAPILKHFLAVRRGGEKSAEAVHGSTSERSAVSSDVQAPS